MFRHPPANAGFGGLAVTMGIALLLLGLVPLFFLGDLFVGGGAGAPASEDGDEAAQEGGQGNVSTLLGAQSDGTPLEPVTDDPQPYVGAPVEPGTIIDPNEDDADPVTGTPVDPDTVLDPIDTPGEGYERGSGTTLQQLLDRETDLRVGVERIGSEISETAELLSSDEADRITLANDGPGEGNLSDIDGTPLIHTDGMLGVIEGAGGDDTLVLGNSATYAFGGAGADNISAATGAAAIFGGTGDDMLRGGTGDGFIDGGAGDDVILGGDGAENLFGGAHAPDSASAADDDLIDGGAGDDRIAGGYGADTLIGGTGDDVIDHHGRVEQQIGWERHAFDWHIDDADDTLVGGTGSDTLIMDRADTGTGGDGADTFWIYHDHETGTGAADITDFDAGTDFLRVSLNPSLDHGELTVDVTASPDGADALVTVNGELVAVLRGAARADAIDLLVEVTPDLFA